MSKAGDYLLDLQMKWEKQRETWLNANPDDPDFLA